MTATATTLDSIRLCINCLVPSDGQWLCGVIMNQAASCSRCDSWEAVNVLYPKANDPRLEGDHRNPDFSTSVTVAPYLPHVWDVNGYYRDLGVRTDATKAELRDAFLTRGGHQSARLTFVLKQLLDDRVRARYDATPLGSIFFDAEVAAEVKRRIAEEVKVARVSGAEGHDMVEVDLDHLMDQGFDFLDKHSKSEDTLRQASPKGQWGWYRWATPAKHHHLGSWMSLLSKSISDRGLTIRLAVGIHNQPEPWIIRRVGYRTVVFFNPGLLPDPILTDHIASYFSEHVERKEP